jgi:large subunit ribosomal protein L10
LPACVAEKIVLRAQKAEVIESLSAMLGSSAVVVVAHYKGLSVPEITELRRSVRAAGGTFRVTKNRLTKRALEGTPYGSLTDLFVGPTAVAVSSDPVAAPKAMVDYARRNDKLAIIGGGLGAQMLDAAAVKALAELPSLDELRARLIAVLQTPAARLVGVLQAPAGQLARVLAARAEQAGGTD